MIFAFDCFGVLVLDPREYFENLAESLDQLQAIEDLFLAKNFGLILKGEFFDQLSTLFEMPRDEVISIFEKELIRNENLFNFLKEKKNAGSKIAVISNVAQYAFDEIFSRQDQADFFDEIILSEVVGTQKPNQRIFEIAQDRFSVPKDQVYFIDDSQDNISAGKVFGWNSILYRNFSKFKKEMEELNA